MSITADHELRLKLTSAISSSLCREDSPIRRPCSYTCSPKGEVLYFASWSSFPLSKRRNVGEFFFTERNALRTRTVCAVASDALDVDAAHASDNDTPTTPSAF